MNEAENNRQIIQLIQGLAETRNFIGTDFDDVKVVRVTDRNFQQQPGGAGYHICFSISAHAFGKTGKQALDAMEKLCPSSDEEP